MNGLAKVSPLLGVPPLRVRVSELPLQWQGRGLGRVGVVAVHVDIFSREILAGLLGLVGRLVGCGLANGGCGIGARKGRGDAGDGHLARDGRALRKAQCSEGRGHGVWIWDVGGLVVSGEGCLVPTLDQFNARARRPVAGSPSSSSFRTTMMLLVPAWTSADWLPEGDLTFRQRVNFVRAFKAHAQRITTPSGRYISTTAARTENPAFPQQSAHQTLPLDCPGRNSGIGSMTVGGVRPR